MFINILPRYRVVGANTDYKIKNRSGKLTTDEYIYYLKNNGINTTIPDEEYKGCNTSIYHICQIHNYRFKAQPNNILHGFPCPLCNKEKNRLNYENNYKQKLIDKNISVRLDDNYISHTDKVYHICLVCNNRWKTSPNYVLRNKFPCPECAKQITAKNKMKAQEEYKKEVYKIFGDSISIIGTYNGARHNIDMLCNICGYIWSPTASSILAKHGCPRCTNHYTISHNEFLDKIKDAINPNIELLSQYEDSKTPIKCKCKNCGYLWTTKLDRILKGNGCRKCADIKQAELRTVSIDEITNRLHKKFPQICIIGNYVNTRSKTTCKCTVCNNIWDTQLSSLLTQKYGCPRCALEIKRKESIKTHDDYISDVRKHNPYIEAVSRYQGGSQDIVAKCLICNNEWTTKAYNLLRCGCPQCTSSKGEMKVKKYLDMFNISYIHQQSYEGLVGINGGLLSYDFYLQDYNLLIEFQGEQHEHPIEYFGGDEQFDIQAEHDRRKREYARLHNIPLLEIWYYDIDNTENILTETLNNLKLESVETVIPPIAI